MFLYRFYRKAASPFGFRRLKYKMRNTTTEKDSTRDPSKRLIELVLLRRSRVLLGVLVPVPLRQQQLAGDPVPVSHAPQQLAFHRHSPAQYAHIPGGLQQH